MFSTNIKYFPSNSWNYNGLLDANFWSNIQVKTNQRREAQENIVEIDDQESDFSQFNNIVEKTKESIIFMSWAKNLGKKQI